MFVTRNKADRRRSAELALLVIGVAALGYNLRGAITSLPPLFPELQSRLHLSAAVVSVLAATPVICFGVVSGFAAAFSRRLGEERVLGIAAGALVIGLLLRGAVPGVLLFPGTILASAAIAVMNVLLSSLIKRRWPERAGFLIGLYITALSVGAITASLVSVPLWNGTDGSIPIDLGWLAGPAALAALFWLLFLAFVLLDLVVIGVVSPKVAGWEIFVVGFLAWYIATATLVNACHGRMVLPHS